MAEESEDPAERAFQALQGEISALRRELAALRATRPEPAPDYTPTLAKMSAVLKQLADRPAVPDGRTVGAEVKAAVEAALYPKLIELRGVISQVEAGAGHFQAVTRSIQTGRNERVVRWTWGTVGAAIGLVLWMLAAGPLARAMPASWHVPERMAAATLNEDRATGGQRMIASVDPQGWKASLAAIRLYVANREAIAGCRAAAAKTDKARRCMISVPPRG